MLAGYFCRCTELFLRRGLDALISRSIWNTAVGKKSGAL